MKASNAHERNSFDYDDLVACAEGHLFNEQSARLPLPGMLMVDRITHISGEGGTHNKGEVIAEMDIKPDQWFFNCHFQDDPVMPGCLGLDALWQLTGFFLTWRGNNGHGRALGSGEVKFFGQVLPKAKKLTYKLDIARVIERKLTMAIANGTVYVDDREIYTAKNLRVGLFTSTDNF